MSDTKICEIDPAFLEDLNRRTDANRTKSAARQQVHCFRAQARRSRRAGLIRHTLFHIGTMACAGLLTWGSLLDPRIGIPAVLILLMVLGADAALLVVEFLLGGIPTPRHKPVG